jgi:HlyD family secretion protein
MDREIPKAYLNKKRRKRVISLLLVLILIATVIVVLFNALAPKVSLKTLLLSTADVGAVENSFITNGLVEPFYQEMLTASLSADVLEILHHPGDLVKPGDTLIVPDIGELDKLLKNIDHEIALKKNHIRRSREELNSKHKQLEGNLKRDSIRMEHLRNMLVKEEYLLEIGGGSQQEVDKAKLEFQLASLSRQDQTNEFESFKQLQKLDLEAMKLELELKLQQKEEVLDRIDKAFVRPKIKGVITSVLVEPGQHLNEGQPVAHVADAERFKIEGAISSRYANKIFPGQEAQIFINDSILTGKLLAISPAVNNGSINYTVYLDRPANALLRAKLQVEVRLIISVTPTTVRIANGDYYYGPGTTELFVMDGDKLYKRSVKLGGANFDYVEVVSGLMAGEKVVVSKSFNQKYQRYNSLSCAE